MNKVVNVSYVFSRDMVCARGGFLLSYIDREGCGNFCRTVCVAELGNSGESG